MIDAGPSERKLYALAPLELPNRRPRRYHGDTEAVTIDNFTPGDQSTVHSVYVWLNELRASLAPEKGAARKEQLVQFLEHHPPDSLVEQVVGWGKASYAAAPSPVLAKAIHDVRGGALGPLLAHLQLAGLDPRGDLPLDSLYYLCRDHLKIMRNALLGVDDRQRELDLQIRLHGSELLLQKWRDAVIPRFGGSVKVDLKCAEEFEIAECCVEFGALDRIIYNIVNNAARHTADEKVSFMMFPIPEAKGRNIRFIILNTVRDADRAMLEAAPLERLFSEGVSSTGSGYGLSIASDFVAHCYGLDSPEEAIEGGYLGAALVEDLIAVWFHWPRVGRIFLEG